MGFAKLNISPIHVDDKAADSGGAEFPPQSCLHGATHSFYGSAESSLKYSDIKEVIPKKLFNHHIQCEIKKKKKKKTAGQCSDVYNMCEMLWACGHTHS